MNRTLPRFLAAFLLLALLGSAAANAQDASSTLEGVTEDQATRLYMALTERPKASVNKRADREKVAEFEWAVNGHRQAAEGWLINGRITGTYSVRNLPTFNYAKNVILRYDVPGQQLRVSIVEGAEERGKYNIEITRTTKRALSLGVNVASSTNFSLGFSSERKKQTAFATNLPYVLHPHLELRRVEGFLQLRLGIRWQSNAELSAEPFTGSQSSHNTQFNLRWSGQSVVAGELGNAEGQFVSESGTFEGTISLSSTGEGVLGRLVYSEADGRYCYSLSLKAQQAYAIAVPSVVATIDNLHFEEIKNVGNGRRLPELVGLPPFVLPERVQPELLGESLGRPSSDMPTTMGARVRRVDTSQVNTRLHSLRSMYGAGPTVEDLVPSANDASGLSVVEDASGLSVVEDASGLSVVEDASGQN